MRSYDQINTSKIDEENNMKRYRSQNFRNWWAGIRSHETVKQREIIRNWLKYARLTVSMRGDNTQQKIVYTIADRHKNSQYGLARKEYKRVYNIVNKKQINYKEEQRRLIQLKEEIKRLSPAVKVVRKKRIIAHGTSNR